MKTAAESLAESTLKTLDVGEFTAALVRQATAWSTLRWFYGGKTFAKRRFLLAKRKQHFEEKAVNRLIAESERGRDLSAPWCSRMETGSSRFPCKDATGE